MKNIFIIGSKGIPAKYGGFETFVDKLVSNKMCNDIQYHVSCMSDNNNEFYYKGARCFNIKTLEIGAVKAVYYDIMALKECINYIKDNSIKNAIIYILACRIGPFIGYYKGIIKKLGIKLLINPDGHEWKRGKWNTVIKNYWKISEKLMVKHADLLVCDSQSIENYIKKDYKKFNPETIFIAYGADIKKSKLQDNDLVVANWYRENQITKNGYYLIVGRFVPENNYETMITEFMKSNTNKNLVLITNVEHNSFYDKLRKRTKFEKDERIKFVGTVYDEELLKKIRENAYGYIHGHEVGGTNPSLLEALATTNINILLNVGFNEEVGKEGALYFDKNKGHLTELINKLDEFECEYIEKIGIIAKTRIRNHYTWEKIVHTYENLFLQTK